MVHSTVIYGLGPVPASLRVIGPDVDGDGRADICARAEDGVQCALNEGGTTFGATTRWTDSFSDANGWSNAAYYTSIHYPDLDGDGSADICSRAPTGMLCGLSDRASSFAVSSWSTDFSNGQGFDAVSSTSTLRTPVLDGGVPCP